jgi:hypothetical protein
MVNSNENTQNPKDDQERMADEGIQDHSEHTAENKQPESEDDVQNKDKPTCLCKFFKKIAEWICPRKNKNSNKTDENAAKNDDAAKQEEMKQADTVEQPKKQRKPSDHLETISKLIGISTVLGILAGGFVIFAYLLKINQLSILPDVISNPSSLIAANTVFIIIFIIIFLLYYILMHSFMPELFLLKQDFCNLKSPESDCFNKCIILGVRSLFVIFNGIIICELSKILKNFLVYLFPQAKNTNISLFLLILIILSIVMCYFYKNLIDYLDSIDKIFIKVCMTVAITLCLLIFSFSDKAVILYFTHSIEISENSSWYLLHNNFQQNNGFQETNGINKSDLKALKKRFNSNLCTEKGLKEHTLQYYSTPASRENALYGYMAWNLGDTKVFCPPTVDNTEADFTEAKGTKEREAADKLAEECIVISGKALQIMPEGYISTEPIQQPKYDVKEPTIEINCCNCNPNSPKNKDNHPDIEYTDKKICQ